MGEWKRRDMMLLNVQEQEYDAELSWGLWVSVG